MAKENFNKNFNKNFERSDPHNPLAISQWAKPSNLSHTFSTL